MHHSRIRNAISAYVPFALFPDKNQQSCAICSSTHHTRLRYLRGAQPQFFSALIRCQKHYKRSQLCAICDRPDPDQVWRESGELFCRHHRDSLKSAAKCFSCKRPELMKGAAPFSSLAGVLACKLCREVEGLVTSPEELEICVDVVLVALKKLGISGFGSNIEVCLRSYDWFEQNYASNIHEQFEAVTEKEFHLLGVFRSAKVYVCSGMSKSQTLLVLAHEFMHAYLHFSRVDHLSIELEEQLCEIGAYLALLTFLFDWDLISSAFKGNHDLILSKLFGNHRNILNPKGKPWKDQILNLIGPTTNLEYLIKYASLHNKLPPKY